MIKRKTALIASFIILSVLSGCVDAVDEATESQDEHVCEHLEYGPVEPVAAYPTAAEAAADSLNYLQLKMHTRYDIELISDGSRYTGFIGYSPVSPEMGDGEYILYLGTPADAVIYEYGQTLTEIPAETVYDHSDECSLMTEKRIYDLEVDKIYVLSVTSDSTVVSMLLPRYAEEADDHDHE